MRISLFIGAFALAGSLTAATFWWPFFSGAADQREVKIDDLNTSASMKSWVICGFADGFDWPSQVKSGGFRIGVLGDKDLLKFLMNNCHMNQYGNQIVEVVDAPDAPEDAFYHILYVGDVESTSWKLWKKHVKDLPTLVVAQSASGIPDQAVVNIHFVSGLMQLQIDGHRAAELGLSIGNELKSFVE